MTSLFVIDPSNKKELVDSAKEVFKASKYKEFREGCFESSAPTGPHHTVVKELKTLKVKFYHAFSANKV